MALGSNGYCTDLGIPSIALSPAESAAGHSLLLGVGPCQVSWSPSPSPTPSWASSACAATRPPASCSRSLTATPQARLRLRVSQPAGLHPLEHVELLPPAGILASPDTLHYHTLAGGVGIALAAAALTPSSLSHSLISPLLLDLTQRPAPGLGSSSTLLLLSYHPPASCSWAGLATPPSRGCAAPLPVHILLPSPSRHVPLLGPPPVARKPL